MSLTTVYIDSNVGVSHFDNGTRNNGTEIALESIHSALVVWREVDNVHLKISAGEYRLGDLSFTRDEDFSLKWYKHPILFANYNE